MKGSTQKATSKSLTPLVLQQLIAADRAPTRAWNDSRDFKGTRVSARGTRHEADLDKSAMLRVFLPLEALRALPSDGIPLKEVVNLPLAEIAPAAGYRCESSFARARKRCPLVEAEGRYGSPNHYVYPFSSSTRPRGKRRWNGNNQPSSLELSQHPTMSKHFFGSQGGGGYYTPPGFIYSKHFPGTPNDKLVLSTLAKFGAFGKGVLENIPQRVIASATGLCTDTICSILRKYSIYTRKIFERNTEGQLRAKKVLDTESGRMKSVRIEERGEFPLFRIINRPARYEKDGRPLEHWEQGAELKQPPNKIVYIGDRMLDQRTGVLETQRLLAIAEAQHMRAELWWEHVARVHGTLLREWVGTEKHQSGLWEACSIRLQAEASMNGRGVPGKALDLLFPKGRPPD